MPDLISFNRPTLVGEEFGYIREALERMHLSGNGYFTRRCQELIERRTLGSGSVLLTHSCTAAPQLTGAPLKWQLGRRSRAWAC